jgi:hypothetical protein
MTRKIIRIVIVLLLLLGLPLAAWRAYLAQQIKRELAKIRAAGRPANGEELNHWYAAVPDTQNAALVLTQAFALRQNYSDQRSSLINHFKLPKRGETLTNKSSCSKAISPSTKHGSKRQTKRCSFQPAVIPWTTRS